jgi:hypothetical protein
MRSLPFRAPRQRALARPCAPHGRIASPPCPARLANDVQTKHHLACLSRSTQSCCYLAASQSACMPCAAAPSTTAAGMCTEPPCHSTATCEPHAVHIYKRALRIALCPRQRLLSAPVSRRHLLCLPPPGATLDSSAHHVPLPLCRSRSTTEP